MKTRMKQAGQGCVMAVVLGTALSTLGSSRSFAAVPSGISSTSVQDLSRYCTACWRNARLPVDRWPDCTQEVFTRLLSNLEAGDWPRLLERDQAEHRELIRAVDAVKKRSQRDRARYVPLSTGTLEYSSARESSFDREAVAHAARRLLSARQQRILQMSLEGWTVQDIAGELDLSSDRVSDEKYKAIRKLREHFSEIKSHG